MKIPYDEGTCFAVPLTGGGFGIGVVARTTKRGGTILVYFFGPRQPKLPNLEDAASRSPEEALLVVRVGDLRLINGDWQILGKSPSWDRSCWPMPVFIRRGILPPFVNWLVYFSDLDPKKRVKEQRETEPRPDLAEDSLYGARALEVKLSTLLT